MLTHTKEIVSASLSLFFWVTYLVPKYTTSMYDVFKDGFAYRTSSGFDF